MNLSVSNWRSKVWMYQKPICQPLILSGWWLSTVYFVWRNFISGGVHRLQGAFQPSGHGNRPSYQCRCALGPRPDDPTLLNGSGRGNLPHTLEITRTCTVTGPQISPAARIENYFLHIPRLIPIFKQQTSSAWIHTYKFWNLRLFETVSDAVVWSRGSPPRRPRKFNGGDGEGGCRRG